MEHLYEYLGFLARVATVVVALLLVISSIAALAMKRQQQQTGHLEIRKLNEHYLDLKFGVQEALLPAPLVKKARKQEEKTRRAADKAAARSVEAAADGDLVRKRVFVIDFNGDLHASQVKALREEVTAILTVAQPGDEVVVRLESPGGMVHGYGLAASQLARIRDAGVTLTAIVDKVAASGGYLMAAVADRILAAPFAVVGSIGVVAQVPNVHRLLKRHDVDVEVLTAGRFKRTLTVFGENTDAARQKFIEELEEVHGLFQSFVGTYRPQLDLERVATGESWHGQHALDLALIDELSTSDAWLLNASDAADLFEISWVEHRRPIDRLMGQVESRLETAAERLLGKFTNWKGGA